MSDHTSPDQVLRAAGQPLSPRSLAVFLAGHGHAAVFTLDGVDYEITEAVADPAVQRVFLRGRPTDESPPTPDHLMTGAADGVDHVADRLEADARALRSTASLLRRPSRIIQEMKVDEIAIRADGGDEPLPGDDE